MALPGTPGQRISDLCNGNHITQKELAEKIGVSASQLSRIVSGETRTVSSDILIGVAKEFKVSTDYILGLSTVSVRKSYDISELGLSEGAVRGLVTGTVDVQILNRLLEHRNFPKLIDLIRIYFQDTAAKGIMARNQLIEMATAYGSALGLDSTGLLLALLLTQVVAFPCALIFSRLSRTYKTEKLLKICIIAYFIYFML